MNSDQTINNMAPSRQAILNENIQHKLDGWDRTRHNRLHASERLKGYADIWSVLTFIVNIVAIIFIIFSFELNSSRTLLVTSSLFSCYVIILQYFLSTRDYNARSLKLHYQQLEIEDLRRQLKQLQFLPSQSISVNEEKFKDIIACYQTSLRGNENHVTLDDRRYNAEKHHTCSHIFDFTLDQLFIYLKCIVLFAMIALMCKLYF